MSEFVLDMHMETQLQARPPTMRWCRIGKLALLCAVASIVLTTWALGSGTADLAVFRRHSKGLSEPWLLSTEEAGIVELAGVSQAVDGFVCFLDVYESVLRLMFMVLVFRDMATACAPGVAEVSVSSRNSCQSNWFTALRQLLFMISFISQAISDCMGTLVVPAACAAGATGFAATLTNIASGVAIVMSNCEPWYKNEHVTPYGVSPATLRSSRRLGALPWPKLAPTADPYPTQLASYGTSIAKCVNIVGQLWHYVVRGILIFGGVEKSCTGPKTKMVKGKKTCAANVFTLLATISVWAQFSGASTALCQGVSVGDQSVKDAQCVQGVTSFTTAIFAATSVGLKFDAICPASLLTSTLPPEPTPVPINHWLTTSVLP